MTARTFELENDRSRRDLGAFAASLDDAALGAAVGGGWTVAMTLAHTAFWDLQTAGMWRRRGDQVTPADLTDQIVNPVNDGLEPLLAVIPGPAAVQLVLSAAAAVDGVVAALPDAVIDAARAEGKSWMVDAWEHRDEHLEQARRALASGR